MLRPALGLIKFLVGPLAAPSREHSREHDQEAANEDQTATEAVEGLVGPGPEVGAEPMAALRDAVRNGNQSRLLRTRSRDDRGLPGELEVETVVGTRDQDEEGKVPRPDVLDGDEDRAADGTDDDGDDNVPEMLLAFTGRPRQHAGDGVREGVGRSLDEVGGELAKVEGVDDLSQNMLV